MKLIVEMNRIIYSFIVLMNEVLWMFTQKKLLQMDPYLSLLLREKLNKVSFSFVENSPFVRKELIISDKLAPSHVSPHIITLITSIPFKTN